ncbi:MAG: aldehyde dehydrogenase family protein [Proteobacteria bacterium]|nr:aldehyde dehydrogenase family protein [Pseudomonadota bacterium]
MPARHRWRVGLGGVLALAVLAACSDPEAFPSCCDPTGEFDVPFSVTNRFNFRTGVQEFISRDLEIFTTADVLTLQNAANVQQLEGFSIISGRVLGPSGPQEGVALYVADADGLSIGRLFYNSIGGVPELFNLAFTGSTEVGKKIQAALAGTGRDLTLELGGKAANIVFADAAIDQAVEGIVNGIFFNQGHVCCAGSRLLVQESVADEVIAKLKDRMETLIVGDPLDKNTDIGAINSPMQLEKIESYLKIGQEEGGEMHQSSCRVPKRGYWCRPTIFTGVSQSSRVVQEEIFGPVLAIQTFRSYDEALSKANNSPYGLSGGIWTDKGAKIFHMTQQIRAGVVWANTFNKFDPTSPFGGYKESGVGREGGLHGLDAYVKLGA